jgi:hypothetical protein
VRTGVWQYCSFPTTSAFIRKVLKEKKGSAARRLRWMEKTITFFGQAGQRVDNEVLV